MIEPPSIIVLLAVGSGLFFFYTLLWGASRAMSRWPRLLTRLLATIVLVILPLALIAFADVGQAAAQQPALRHSAEPQKRFDDNIRLGEQHEQKGQLVRAFASYRAALGIALRVTKANPGNVAWQRSLALAHRKVGAVQEKRGDKAGALRSYQAALAISERLAASDPSRTDSQGEIEGVRDRIAGLGEASPAKPAAKPDFAPRPYKYEAPSDRDGTDSAESPAPAAGPSPSSGEATGMARDKDSDLAGYPPEASREEDGRLGGAAPPPAPSPAPAPAPPPPEKAYKNGGPAAPETEEMARSPAPGDEASAPSAEPPPPPEAAAPEAAQAPDDDAIPAEKAAPRSRSAAAAVEKPADYDIVPVFYGTDREREAAKPKREIAYGFARARRLELGRAEITVPKIHTVPNVERPWVVTIPLTNFIIYEEREDPKRHFTIKQIAALDKAAFLQAVAARLAGSTRFKDHAFVFVHGYNTTFDNALYRTAQIAYDMKFDGAPFLYSWPSQGRLENYPDDRASAEQSPQYLREFLRIVCKETGAKTVSIIAHSMGNEPLLDVLRDFKNATPPEIAISQLIFAAPDVDRDKFASLASDFNGIAKGVTLYAAGNDRALRASRTFWGEFRAGDVPSDGPILVPGVETIDVTAASTDVLSLNHSGYATNKALLWDIALLVEKGVHPPQDRFPPLVPKTGPKGGYWLYDPALLPPELR